MSDRAELPADRVTDVRRDGMANLGLASLFVLVALLAGYDLLLDLQEGTTTPHLVAEAAVIVVGLAGASWIVARTRAVAREARALRAQAVVLASGLEASRAEAARWRAEAAELIDGLAAAIDRQLAAWGLTAAEQEVALFILKGLSHKEVAALRGVGETTVRQQAGAIYKKSGLTGRHELAAFFLEDLLGPRAGYGK